MSQSETLLTEWQRQQELAEQMQPLIGSMYRNNGIVLRMYGRLLINCSTIDLIKAHRLGKQFEQEELSLDDTFPVLKALSEMNLGAARIDLGKLAAAYRDQADGQSLEDFLGSRLGEVVGANQNVLEQPQDVVLYGFGRIGRLLARLLIERTGGGQKLRLKAIVVRRGKGGDLEKRASLLRRDSVHGQFDGTITVDEENNAIIANGNYIQIIYANNPSEALHPQ